MNERDGSLTPEDIKEIYRLEKKSKRLSDMRPDFYRVVVEHMDQLKRTIAREISTEGYSQKAKYASAQLTDIKRVSFEIFRFRYDKVHKLALTAAAGGKVDIKNFTPEEREYFNAVLQMLKSRYEYICGDAHESTISISSTSEPIIRERIPDPPSTLKEEDASEELDPETAAEDDVSEELEILDSPETEEQTIDAQISGVQILVRVLQDIPEIAGIVRNYKLGKEDIVTLPASIAKILIAQGAAAPIRTELIE